MTFPKEMERGLFDNVDRRFIRILLLCLLFVYGGMILLVATHSSLSEVDVSANDEALQRLLSDTVQVTLDPNAFEPKPPDLAVTKTAETPTPVAATPAETPTPKPAGGGDTKPRAEGGGNQREQGGRGDRAVDEARSKYQAQINDQVNNSGLFADLTAKSRTSGRGGPGTGADRGPTDVLGGAAGGEGNLSTIVSGATGTGGGGGAGIGIGNGRGRGDGTGVGRGTGGGTGTDATGSGSGLGSGTGIGSGSGVGRSGSVAAKRRGTGTKTGSSTRDISAIEKYIASQDAAIRACYANAKNTDPSLSGSVTVGFRIKPDGRTVAVRVANSSLRSDVVERCMQNKMRSWNFPAAPAGDTEDLIISDLEYVFSD